MWQIYLLMGYYYTATEEYDIKWTMPHCVLTLKLIGMIPAFNLPHLLLLRMYVFTNGLFLTIYHKALKVNQHMVTNTYKYFGTIMVI